MRIDDGQGKGFQAGVDKTNRLKTIAVAVSQQHHASIDHGKAFQISGSYTVTGAGTFNLLHLVNTSDTDLIVGTYIRPQVAGLAGGTFGTATYFTQNFGGEYSSGGTAVSAVNMNQTSGNVPSITAYGNNPTLTGTLTEFDRWHPEQGTDELVYRKEGTLILGTNDAITFRLVTNNTSGIARVRFSFFASEIEHH